MTQAQPPSGWSEAERDLWRAYRNGEVCNLTRRPEGERVVRDSVLEELLLHGPDAESGRVRKLRLIGAEITGQLDLSHADIPVVVWLDDCRFELVPHLGGASLRELSFEGSTLPGVWAPGLRLTGSFFGTRMKVEQGCLNLSGAAIGGSLNLEGATLTYPGGNPLDATNLVVGANVLIRTDGEGNRFTSTGSLRLYAAQIGGSLEMAGAHLINPDSEAMHAERMSVNGHLRGVTDATGNRFTSTGSVRLYNAHVGGSLEIDGAHLSSAHSYGLNGEYLRVNGSLLASTDSRGNRFTCNSIRLYAAAIGGNLEVDGSELTNPEGETLNGEDLVIGQNMFARTDRTGKSFTSTGTLRMRGATVRSHLDLSDATLVAVGRPALNLIEVTAGTTWLGLNAASSGDLKLQRATLGAVQLEPQNWPTQCAVDMEGLSYDRIPGLDTEHATVWLAWIRKHSGDRFHPHAYEQLAQTYRRDGNDRAARIVLRAKEKHRHRTGNILVRFWGRLQQFAVGYGYRPGLALFWLGALLSAGTFYFSRHELPPIKPTEAPSWNPFVYTLDLIVPLLDLGHEHAFDPTGTDLAVSLGLFGSGLVLAAAVIAGAGRTLKRQ